MGIYVGGPAAHIPSCARYYLFSGVGLGVLAILSMARAHHLMDIQREEAINSTDAAKTSSLAEEPLLASDATMPVQSERLLPTERSAHDDGRDEGRH